MWFFFHDSNNVNGSYFANLTALDNSVTVDSLLAAEDFSVTVGANFSLYDTWGIFATSNHLETTYSYGGAGIALGGILANELSSPLGAVGGPESATDITRGFNQAWMHDINSELGNLQEGAVASSSFADYDNSPGRIANPGTNLVALEDSAYVYFYGIWDTTPEGHHSSFADETTQFHLLDREGFGFAQNLVAGGGPGGSADVCGPCSPGFPGVPCGPGGLPLGSKLVVAVQGQTVGTLNPSAVALPVPTTV